MASPDRPESVNKQIAKMFRLPTSDGNTQLEEHLNIMADAIDKLSTDSPNIKRLQTQDGKPEIELQDGTH